MVKCICANEIKVVLTLTPKEAENLMDILGQIGLNEVKRLLPKVSNLGAKNINAVLSEIYYLLELESPR